MNLILDRISKEAMEIPVSLRVQLADMSMEGLETEETDDVLSLWAREAVRRRDEIRSGKIQPIPGEQVLDEVRQLAR
uniref:Addiction module component n=1 Tax=Candidatus Kentrum sp. LPFa TaxID=2126335 RepID=A0A450WJ90_9GAMM|nr:MAG: Putative addiction module component [Candidatus Kentron sp. LPFa]VFK32233.1 MAG: Putative addiction module component [Candidatus Kentron sp. LPFa]